MRNQLQSLLSSSFISPRQTYTPLDLGCPIISNHAKRIDFSLRNIEGSSYKCSYYKHKSPLTTTCVVYLHSMGGSRVESCGYARRLVGEGVGFASLDFCGSGVSEGVGGSLGRHSWGEVVGLVGYLGREYGVEKVVLWGRSMGAAIAVKVLEQYEEMRNTDNIMDTLENKNNAPRITALILDSPFSSLHKLILQIAQQKMLIIPKVFIKGTPPLNTAVINLMRNTIENVIQCHLDDYELLPVVEKLEVPMMIICSKEDEVVGYEHAEVIYGAYGGKGKELVFVEGGHTGERGEEVVGRVVEFVGKRGREREREEERGAKGREGREGEGKGGWRKSGVFTKRTSPQKNQTEMSLFDDTYQPPSTFSKPPPLTFHKLSQKKAQTQRSSLFVRSNPPPHPNPSPRQPPPQPLLISLSTIPIKKKPTLLLSSPPPPPLIPSLNLAKSPFPHPSSTPPTFRNKPPTDRVTYESHEKYEWKRFLC